MELINNKNSDGVPKFNGEKYKIWRTRVRGIIDETIMDECALKIVDCASCPDDVDISDWKIWNKVAKGIIMRSLGNSTIHYATSEATITAHGIMAKLDDEYARESTTSEMSLDMKLMSLKYDGSKPLNEHFEIFNEMVNDLEAAAGVPLREANKCGRLLKTLPRTYESVVTALETLTHGDLTISFVKKRLLDYEIKLKDENLETASKVLFVKSRPFNNKFKQAYRQNKNFKKTNNYKKTVKCFQCGRSGHYKKDCFHFKRSLKHQNQHQPQQQQQNETYAERSANTLHTLENSKGFAFMIGNKMWRNTCSKTFLLDSGASDHIINNEMLFEDFTTIEPPMRISTAQDGGYITATKRGVVKLLFDDKVPIVLEDVLFCKEAVYNLLSVPKMQKAGMSVHFDSSGISIKKNGEVIILNYIEGKLPMIKFKSNNQNHYINSACRNEYDLWHQRLGHVSKNKFIEIKNSKMFVDVDIIRNVCPNDKICEACILGKQSRLKYNKEKDKEYIDRPLFVVHTDVCGPITPTTVDEKKYYIVFIDQFTHYCVTYLMSRKSDVFEMFQDFCAKCEAHFGLKIVHLYCDNGKEYLSNEMKQFCMKKGISYHLTVPYTPQLNGVAERMIRTLTEKARSMIHFAKLEKNFWGEAVLTATYLTNRTPSNALLSIKKTPFELWHKRKPQIKYLKVFGSTVYIHNKIRQDKFEEKSKKGILVGYEPNGYKVWCVENSMFLIARDVIFDETNYLISRPSGQSDKGDKENHQDKTIKEIVNKRSDELDNVIEFNDKSHKDDDQLLIDEDNSEENENDTEHRRSKRIRLMPKVSYESFLLSAESMINSVPSCYEDVKNSVDKENWEQAINEEIQSHLENQTWQIVKKKDNCNIVDNKWVFTIKSDENGRPVRYKARLVAKGFTQQYLTDYDETYAPVARIASFRFILAFANQNNLLVHQMDVKTAFLNGTLKEEIFMKVPEGIKCKENAVCKLNKAIYGLKQAARCWFEVFDSALKEKGFINSQVDRCIYMLDKGNLKNNIYVLLYVDDVIIVTDSLQVLIEFKEYLKSKFKMTDLGEIKYFVGIKIERSKDKMYLSQSAYIKTILQKYNMSDCKPVNTPLPNKLNYEALNSKELFEAPCRNVIGCLMYLMTCTRPDLSVSVNFLSRYTSNSNKELWQNLKRVLRYLKGTINLKLVFKANAYTEILTGYADSDWGGNDTSDRKSTTGYLFKMYETSIISWNTKRQLSVAASSTEAEYMALFKAIREAVWLRSLANSIDLEIKDQIKIFEDNQGCISIANNPACHRKSKHIDIKYHYNREQIMKKIIKLEYLPTEYQLADALTKPIPMEKFLRMRKEMGLEDDDSI